MPGTDGAIVLPIPGNDACLNDARNLLERKGHKVKEVLAVDHDSILYLDADSQAMTAWLSFEYTPSNFGPPTRQLKIDVVAGFQI
jgi:hypothetical protein